MNAKMKWKVLFRFVDDSAFLLALSLYLSLSFFLRRVHAACNLNELIQYMCAIAQVLSNYMIIYNIILLLLHDVPIGIWYQYRVPYSVVHSGRT